MKAIQYIRLIGKEFISLTDAELHLWVEMVRPMVSRKQFGKLYEQAIAYLVCHKLKMAGYGENPLGDMGAIGIGFAVGSVSEGGSSISFGANQSSNLATDAELGLTAYGVQFLQLRRMVIVPIHCSGELDSSGGKGKNNPCIVPVASDAVLGGIKVRPGSGLKLEPDGTLSVDREEPYSTIAQDTLPGVERDYKFGFKLHLGAGLQAVLESTLPNQEREVSYDTSVCAGSAVQSVMETRITDMVMKSGKMASPQRSAAKRTKLQNLRAVADRLKRESTAEGRIAPKAESNKTIEGGTQK